MLAGVTPSYGLGLVMHDGAVEPDFGSTAASFESIPAWLWRDDKFTRISIQVTRFHLILTDEHGHERVCDQVLTTD